MIGNVGGVLTPIIVGRARDLTGSFATGFLVTGAMMAISASIAFSLRHYLGTARPAPSLRLQTNED